jgi:hypothetical protein
MRQEDGLRRLEAPFRVDVPHQVGRRFDTKMQESRGRLAEDRVRPRLTADRQARQRKEKNQNARDHDSVLPPETANRTDDPAGE